jgi:hypothetical protein
MSQTIARSSGKQQSPHRTRPVPLRPSEGVSVNTKGGFVRLGTPCNDRLGLARFGASGGRTSDLE